MIFPTFIDRDSFSLSIPSICLRSHRCRVGGSRYRASSTRYRSFPGFQCLINVCQFPNDAFNPTAVPLSAFTVLFDVRFLPTFALCAMESTIFPLNCLECLSIALFESGLVIPFPFRARYHRYLSFFFFFYSFLFEKFSNCFHFSFHFSTRLNSLRSNRSSHREGCEK